MKFSSYIIKRSPPIVVVLRDFGIPLGHSHVNSLTVVSAGTADLLRDDGIPLHSEGSSGIWFYGSLQYYFHNGFLNFKFQSLAVLLYPVDVLCAFFIFRNRRQCRNSSFMQP